MGNEKSKSCNCFANLSESMCCEISGKCEANGKARSLTNCIHCGAELIEVDRQWYHWTQFENGKLTSADYPQDYIFEERL